MKLNNRAFTLAELIVSIAVSVMVVGAVLGTFMTAKQFYVSNISGQNLQRDADLLLSKIIKGKTEPGGVFRLSEATSYSQATISELHFTGLDGNERWYKLSPDGGSVLYHHPATGGVQDEAIYTAPQGCTLSLRFWVPFGANFSGVNLGIDVALSQNILGKTASGSASTMLNIRNHPT